MSDQTSAPDNAAPDQPLEGRRALITGASRGIGLATAIELAKRGADIVAVARSRSQGALEELDDTITGLGRHCTIAPIDLAIGDDIDKLCAVLYERFGKIDMVFGNAGLLGSITPLSHVAPKDFTRIMDVNITANYRLMRGAEPLLRASDAPRALYVTSGAAHKMRPYWGPYAASKAALESLALTYAAEVKHTGIKVNMLDPGPIRTAMRAAAMPGEDGSTLPHPNQVAPLVADLLSPSNDRHGEIVKFYDWAGIPRD